VSVKIVGIKKLNANVYDKMVIREIDNNYIVNVTGNKLSDKFIVSSYKLSDSLKNISDNEKIISIVDSFLENTKINNIDMLVLCIGYRGEFILVEGTRKLYLQINNDDLLKRIMKMIGDKYNRDRFEYCMDSDSSNINSFNINFCDKVSSYNRYFISCDDCTGCKNNDNYCDKYIEFKLIYKDGMIANFDKIFIERFIYDKLCEVAREACVYVIEKDVKSSGVIVGRYISGYCIICGELGIRFNCTPFNKDDVINFCNNIVNRYNSEFNCYNDNNENIKKRQLIIEGF